jgi:hypothetical protein
MKRTIITLALVGFAFSCMTVCMAKTVIKENRETGAFQKISAGSGIDVYFTQSASGSVVVEADEKYIGDLITEVDGETLVIKMKKSIFRITGKTVRKVHVSAPTLNAVEASSGSDFHASDLKCDGSFELNVTSGADASIANLTVGENIAIAVSSGSDCDIRKLTISGNADISVSSGSDCDVDNLQANDCKLSASSGSDIAIKLSTMENLNLEASSGAEISVSGTANNVKASVSSGADVNIKNLKHTNIEVSKSSGGDVHR